MGTDGHHRCQHEGVAYMETCGPPLICLTPNAADTQHLVIQGEPVDGAASGCLCRHARDIAKAPRHDSVAPWPWFEAMRCVLSRIQNEHPEIGSNVDPVKK